MPAPSERGLSLVELLVGLALGLIIVAAATTLLIGRLQAHRALLLQSRLMQDLRVAADIVTRDLRRAGYWGEASAAPLSASAPDPRDNPFAAISPATQASDAIAFRFSRDDTQTQDVGIHEQFGFRLRRGVIEMLLGGHWQALTDDATLLVTAFNITPGLQEIALDGFCAQPCPAGSTQCPPRQLVRSLAVSISGRAATDPAVVRTMRSEVRLRNDTVVGRCPS
ncbi:prepilin-type N-terminal cleavage/methylation domain-containing protein [Piscinibacter sp. XHJ-5]|uniref:prepilin-type N-terminal cleavage/methylation domain-containing protein n=1 Tax=Piscinibacter sp. XHJ-5 TaxID=3037797 RepID=UPI002452DF6E|nr:prepilin-type N-terminal cleavage/methylation domain-containing protein [Piscinibacter sp. XHJ-5]